MLQDADMKTSYSIITLLCSSLVLSACHKSPEQNTPKTDPQNKVEQQLDATPIKEFPKTEHDAQDIATLIDFNTQFAALSDEMENEMIKMQKDGTLTPEFELSRHRDNIQSAFSMLKELDLHTEQGRYIQGLLYTYWEQRDEALKMREKTASVSVASQLDDLLKAQKQLQHWKQATEKK